MQGIVFPGQEVFEVDVNPLQGRDHDVIVDLEFRGELGLIDLGHDFLIEAVQCIMESVDIPAAEILEGVIVLVIAGQGPGRREELEISIEVAVQEFLELAVLRRLLARKRVPAERAHGQHHQADHRFLH